MQVCENNWIRRPVGVERADKRRMEELRVEIGVKDSFKKKLARSGLCSRGSSVICDNNMRDGKLAKG